MRHDFLNISPVFMWGCGGGGGGGDRPGLWRVGRSIPE